MENKLTDNEIIKALECCTYSLGVMCKKCPSKTTLQGLGCRNKLSIAALDLIKRQKAEIERLQTVKKHINNLILKDCDYATAEAYNKAFIEALERLYDNVNTKSEAIKEFAERLLKKELESEYFSHIAYQALNFDTNNLVKEMVGEKDV